jgi:hypothetical protein
MELLQSSINIYTGFCVQALDFALQLYYLNLKKNFLLHLRSMTINICLDQIRRR